MLYILENHLYISVVIVVIILCSVVLQMAIGNVLAKMVREAENISSTENKQLKQFKLKFVNCYKLNDGMSNVPVFVDRFLEKMSVGKVKISTLHRISGQLMLFAVLLAGLAAARGITLGESISQILPFYLVSFLGLYFYYVANSFAGMDEKKLSLKYSLVDYLDNHMIGRLKQTDYVLNQKLEENPEEEKHEMENIRESEFTEKDKEELEGLLREFFA